MLSRHSPNGGGATELHQMKSHQGNWEHTTTFNRRTTRSHVRRVLNNGKGQLSATYSSGSDSDSTDIHLRGTTVARHRLSHFSETDDDDDHGNSPRRNNAQGGLRRAFSSVLVWIYWAIVQSFVFEKWLLNVTSRSRTTVPHHHCQATPIASRALVRQGAYPSKTRKTNWRAVAGFVCVLTLPVLLYFLGSLLMGEELSNPQDQLTAEQPVINEALPREIKSDVVHDVASSKFLSAKESELNSQKFSVPLPSDSDSGVDLDAKILAAINSAKPDWSSFLTDAALDAKIRAAINAAKVGHANYLTEDAIDAKIYAAIIAHKSDQSHFLTDAALDAKIRAAIATQKAELTDSLTEGDVDAKIRAAIDAVKAEWPLTETIIDAKITAAIHAENAERANSLTEADVDARILAALSRYDADKAGLSKSLTDADVDRMIRAALSRYDADKPVRTDILTNSEVDAKIQDAFARYDADKIGKPEFVTDAEVDARIRAAFARYDADRKVRADSFSDTDIDARILAAIVQYNSEHSVFSGAGGDIDVDGKIRAAIAQYDADKTGRADLALESGGGAIVSTRCTKKSSYVGSQLLIWNVPIWYPSNSPRKVIQGGTMPGDCWSFDGVEGFVVIKLVGPSVVTGFTMEHLPKVLSPHGHIESAPRKFQVVGHLDYTDVENEFVFGTYEYLDNGQPLQYYPVQNESETLFPFVELKILSNHGNVAFTCIYRFRVHGRLERLPLL